MPGWNKLLDEVRAVGSGHDVIRRKHLAALHKLTGRNVIVYYSGWLQKADLRKQGVGFGIDDGDKNGFMAAIFELDRTKGLDLLLHTPGGELAATESLVDYLRSMFSDIRAIVPQIAMSGGTMIALSCREIVMGKHSNLGPIDPQLGPIAAHGIIEEFNRARKEIELSPNTAIPVWQPILAKYTPTLIGECEKAINWGNEIVKDWLVTGMFAGDQKAHEKADRVVTEMGDHALTKSHARHISMRKVKELEINVAALEDDDALQDAVLSVHHACIQTLGETAAIKIIENHNGVAHIQRVQIVQAAS